MASCVVYGCVNRTSRKTNTQLLAEKVKKLTFHKFPRDAARRAVWIEAVHRKNWTPSKSSMMCSYHFTEDCIDRTSLSVVRLRDFAVPSVFPAFPEHLQKKVQLLKMRFENEYRMQLEQEDLKRCALRQAGAQLHNETEKVCKEEPLLIKDEPLPLNICRVCAQFSDDLVLIFGDDKGEELVTKIHTHLPIMVTADDELPLQICGDCLKKLDVCHNLVKVCLNADVTLRQMLGLPLEQDFAAVPSSVSTKQSVPELTETAESSNQSVPVTVGGSKTKPVLVLTTPPIPLSATSEGAKLFPSCPPAYLSVTNNGAVQILGKGEENSVRKKELLGAKETNTMPRIKRLDSCDICDVKFECRNEYLEHKAALQCAYKCHYCDRNFRDKRRWVEHERSHSGERPFMCEVCGKAYRDGSTFKRHMDVHRNRMHTCRVCGKAYNNRSGLYWHEWTHRNATFLCPICGEQVRRGSSVYLHKLRHSCSCLRCNLKFSSWKSLKEHKRSVHKQCPLKCKCCPKTVEEPYPRMSSDPSTRTPLWQCKSCILTFATLRAFNCHMTKKHKHRCLDCKQVLEDENELIIHRQVYCRKVNPGDENRAGSPLLNGKNKKDTRRGVGSAPVKQQTLVFFICHSCGEVFSNERQYNVHKVKCPHSRYCRCSICGKMLKDKYRLLVHKQLHVSQKVYRCRFCSKHFRFLNILKKHCLISHCVSLNVSHKLYKKL